MSTFRKITARDKPEVLARAAARHEEHLRLALGIACRRATRSTQPVRELLGSATATSIAWSLRENIRRHERSGKPGSPGREA
jgi:hypothetical protein